MPPPYFPHAPVPGLSSRSGLWACWAFFVSLAPAQTPGPLTDQKAYGKPAIIATTALAGYATLPLDRQRLIQQALAVAENSPWLPYLFGSADPKVGGFDCSGAMYYVMRSVALDPPRTSLQQLEWVKKVGRLHQVPPGTTDPKHATLSTLRPGDLLFWGIHQSADPPVSQQVTHVAMYLGLEKSDARPVMINSTNGRSYRGTRANGYGVYDFRLPAIGAKISFLGYGTPPGIDLWNTPGD